MSARRVTIEVVEEEQKAWQDRRAMVREQIERRGVKDSAVLAAMRTVPRHLFVESKTRPRAYLDRPLPIGEEQTISQPYMVACMTEFLGVGGGDRVLEVGSGCGYQAAVLAEVCSQVYAIERFAGLAAESRELLARLAYRNVTVKQGDGALGWPEEAPFEGIVVSCGALEIPRALIEQLAPGGNLVIPVGPAGRVMRLKRLTKSEKGGGIVEQSLMDVRFVPLVSPLS